MNEMRERLIQLLSRYFNIGDSYTYNLTRVKSAFAVGTVDLEDFDEYTEDDVADLADYLLDNGVIVPPVKVGQTVYEIDFRKQIRERRVSMITQKANGEFKVRLSSRGCYSSDYTEDELERYVFLTRDAAEAALKAREQNA